MTAPSSIDPARFLHDQLSSASPDLLRSMLTTFVNTVTPAYGVTGSAVGGDRADSPGADRHSWRVIKP